MNRTDIHCPSAIVPEDYIFVACGMQRNPGNVADCETIIYWRKVLQDHMKRTGGKYSNHEHGGNCHICGAWCIYDMIFYHDKTNTYIRVGETCADKLECADLRAFRAFKKGISDARKCRTGKAKAEATLLDKDLMEVWDIYKQYDVHGFEGFHEWAIKPANTIWDIVSKLIRYGDLTPGQWDYLPKLVYQVTSAPERAVEYEKKREAAAPVPDTDDRITIDGHIVSVKVIEPVFEDELPVVKMLIEDKTGYRIFGNAPQSVRDWLDSINHSYNEIKNHPIKFDARVKRSDKDEKFGFFKRPTKVEIA